MLKFRWLMIITLLVVLLGTAAPVTAADTSISQEDPQSVQEIFSSLALLKYYSGSLDYIIQLNRNGSVTNLEKMPFANVPQQMDLATSDFASNSIDFTVSIVDLFGLWNQQNTYIQQSRFNDADVLYKQITDQLPAARQKLAQIKLWVEVTGGYLAIDSLSPQSDLIIVYNEILAKIQQLYNMLNLLSRPFIPTQLSGLLTAANTGLTAAILASLTPGQLAELLKPTQLTLDINPATAYVGDKVNFKGNLSSRGLLLQGREITLLLNNSDLLTVQTDAQGQFQGEFQIPYWYVHEMPVQAIYYPQGDDASIYVAATSPVLNMTILFYEAQLTLQTNNIAYPGKEVILTGMFDYGDAPLLQERTAEVYLDDNLQEQISAGPVFSETLNLNSQITPGQHTVRVSAPPEGRYASVFASYVMNVTQATTILDLNMPIIGLTPGSIQLSGKLYSSVGPLANAVVMITLGNISTQVNTATNGTFSAKIRMGMNLNLLGSQMITLQVQPQEPWNTPIASTKNIFLINFVNTGLILIVLIVLGIYLPRRFKKWFTVQTGKKAGPPELVLPVATPAYTLKAVISLKVKDNQEKQEEAANAILYWYRVALKFVQNITKALSKPQQTLREYGREVSMILGPAGKYFMELTYLLERRLYGRRQPDASDIQKSKQLAAEIQKEAGSKE